MLYFILLLDGVCNLAIKKFRNYNSLQSGAKFGDFASTKITLIFCEFSYQEESREWYKIPHDRQKIPVLLFYIFLEEGFHVMFLYHFAEEFLLT